MRKKLSSSNIWILQLKLHIKLETVLNRIDVALISMKTKQCVDINQCHINHMVSTRKTSM
jgi:hypothetical protein